jgi:peptidoglycan/LPS O-acetylase OafA/YrhL
MPLLFIVYSVVPRTWPVAGVAAALVAATAAEYLYDKPVRQWLKATSFSSRKEQA